MCGLPVVATSVGGVPEMLEDGVAGYLVPDGDEEAFASALVGLLADPERGAELGRSARSLDQALRTRRRGDGDRRGLQSRR